MALALCLTAAAGWAFGRLWSQLPHVRLEHVDWQAVQHLQQSYRGHAREGLILTAVSRRVTAAIINPRRLPDALENARAALPYLRDTQLGRLQLAALVMRRLEHEGMPPDKWWPLLAPFVEGLERASFAHSLNDLIDAEVDTYAAVGLPHGIARRLAHETLANTHGPFLQYFTGRMDMVADAERAAGRDEQAKACRRLVLRLLRQWTHDSAPYGPRLLAAELLAEELERWPEWPKTDATKLAADLRQWRALCRKELESRPPASSILGGFGEPEASPGTERAALRGLARALSLQAATAAAAATTLLLPLWRRLRRRYAQRGKARITAGVALGMALAGAGEIWPTLAGSAVETDLHRLAAEQLGPPWHPFITAVTVVVLVATISSVRRPASGGRRLTCGAELVVWCVLAAAALLGTMRAGLYLSTYADCTSPALPRVYSVDPPFDEANLFLDLQSWSP